MLYSLALTFTFVFYSVVNPPYAEIIVVRHGETEWNADGRIQVLVLFF